MFTVHLMNMLLQIEMNVLLYVINFLGDMYALPALMYLLSSNCLSFQTLPSRYAYGS